jgi:hypothetical protein
MPPKSKPRSKKPPRAKTAKPRAKVIVKQHTKIVVMQGGGPSGGGGYINTTQLIDPYQALHPPAHPISYRTEPSEPAVQTPHALHATRILPKQEPGQVGSREDDMVSKIKAFMIASELSKKGYIPASPSSAPPVSVSVTPVPIKPQPLTPQPPASAKGKGKAKASREVARLGNSAGWDAAVKNMSGL